MVRPSAEYGCQVWDPHYQTDIQFLEKIQKRGARFATNNYNMEHGNTEKNLKTWPSPPISPYLGKVLLSIRMDFYIII